MARFFVTRPIVAMVMSIIIVLLGVVAMRGLPIAQYPEIVPPMIQVTTTFIGASATDVEASVATPLEQQINGVEKGIYLKSTNANDGTLTLKVSFEVGSDQDMDNVLTQNRVSQAMPQMPTSVKNYGVSVKKALAFPLLVISIKSPNGTYDSAFLSNYTTININDFIARIQGVGQINLFGGSDYAMRVWLRPDIIGRLGITVPDIANAISQQNQLTPAGQIGGPPAATGTEYTYTVRTQGRLLNEEEFANIIVRTNPDGSQVHLKDVARLELGTMLYNSLGRHDGKPSAVIAVFQSPGTNALAVADQIKATMADLSTRFPRDMEYVVSLDTTLPVVEGITEIEHTLFEAVALVIIVVFVFLQNWRATLIPLVTVPVSLVGAFIFFPMLGFSINVLSLLGLVLAIGIVVDDAIVVVEAVMHHIEHGKTPHDATVQAMKEVSGPVMAIALILSAVFVPVALLGGLTGRLYQQFALTIAVSVLISAFLALSLAPALCAKMLKPAKPTGGLLGKFYRGFNRVFEVSTGKYVSWTKIFVRRAVLVMAVVGVATLLTGVLGRALPAGFVPDEDMGIFMINAQLPPASSLERTEGVVRQVEAVLKKTEGVVACTGIGGSGILTNSFSPEFASFFCKLEPWDERNTPELHVNGIQQTLRRSLANIPGAVIFPFTPPTIPGFGAAGGFNFLLQDKSGTMSVADLGKQTGSFLDAARKRPELANLFTSFNAQVPQVQVDLDREKARVLGIPINDVFAALSTSMGGAYVNDFNRFGRLYRVYVQAEPAYRQRPDDIGQFYVRSTTTNQMVPLSTLMTVKPASGTEITTRFNLFRSVEITGVPAPGYTSGQAMTALEQTAAQVLPREMGYAYTGFSYQEKNAPPAAPTFVLAIVFVFLLLAALYESWKLPWAVLLETPLVALGAFFGVWLAGYDNNVFVQVGLIMLVGLAAKNAILIVEFAKAQHEGGRSVEDAALEAARLRFRPILMTAFAFIMGVVPLMLAHGAGAGAQTRMGTAVFWGMLIATIVGVFIIPGLFAMVERIGFGKKVKVPPPPDTALPEPVHPAAVSAGGH